MIEIVDRDVGNIAVRLGELCPARLRLVQLVQDIESRAICRRTSHRACPTHRRRFGRNSTNSGGTSVSRRTLSRVTCSSGILATIRRRRRKCIPSRCTASLFEIGHTSALKRVTARTSAQYRRPFTSVAMDDERHRVLRESNTAHAMPQHRLTSGVAEHVGSICVPRYTNSLQGLVLDPSHVNTLIGSTLRGIYLASPSLKGLARLSQLRLLRLRHVFLLAAPLAASVAA